MKSILLLLTFVSFSAFASHYNITMTCGEVSKVRNGELERRLEFNFLGMNDKFVLKTDFKRALNINEIATKKDRPKIPSFKNAAPMTAFTNFSLKGKFRSEKRELKDALKEAKRTYTPLYACVGHIDVHYFKYSGSHVYLSSISIEDAVEKMRKQARRHL